METNPNSRPIEAQQRPPCHYLVSPGTIELWLRRGDSLGRAMQRAASVIAKWRRQAAETLPTDPPAELG